MATANKNSMLPTYQGNYKDMIGALRAGDITNPCWFWIEDKSNIALIHWEKNAQGEKVLSPHIVLSEKIDYLDTQVGIISEQMEGLKDESGEPIKVTEAIANSKEETIAYTDEKIEPVQVQVDEIKENLGTINVII